MESLILVPSSRHVSITNSSAFSSDFSVQFTSRKRAMNFRASSPQILPCNVVLERLTPRSYIRYGPPNGDQDDDPEEQVESLRVPDAWSVPSKALEVLLSGLIDFLFLRFAILNVLISFVRNNGTFSMFRTGDCGVLTLLSM